MLKYALTRRSMSIPASSRRMDGAPKFVSKFTMTRRFRFTAAKWAAERESVRGEPSRPDAAPAPAGIARPAINPADADSRMVLRVGFVGLPLRRGVWLCVP